MTPTAPNKAKTLSLKEYENTQNGGGVSTPQKGVVSHSKCGTKVPLPNMCDTKVSPPKCSHLPHIDLVGHYQFVTFRTYDSVDEFVRKWDLSPAMSNKEKQLKIDAYLDTSANGAYLEGEVLEWLSEFLLSQDKKLYDLVAFAIMNNHVHILFKPLESLSKVMQRVKGVSAKKINDLLGKSGKFWADDYYDKVMRDEKHFGVVYEYIKNNPLKISKTKVPLPNMCDTKLTLANMKEAGLKSHFQEEGGVKAPFPRFYGVYESNMRNNIGYNNE